MGPPLQDLIEFMNNVGLKKSLNPPHPSFQPGFLEIPSVQLTFIIIGDTVLGGRSVFSKLNFEKIFTPRQPKSRVF